MRNFSLLLLLQLLRVAVLAQVCVPALVDPPLAGTVVALLTLRTHAVVAHGNDVTALALDAVEFATGVGTNLATNCKGSPLPAPDGSRVVFVDSLSSALVSLVPPSSARTQLSPVGVVVNSASAYIAVAPNSQWVAFVDNQVAVGVYAAPIAGGGPATRLSPASQVRVDASSALSKDYRWSPDSRYVAYLWKLASGDPFRLFVATNGVADSAIEAMPGVAGSIDNYAWSQDSSTLAVSTGGAVYSLAMANVTGTPVQLTTATSAPPPVPAFSPDGSRVVFMGNWEAVGTVRRWYAAVPGVAMSLMSVSNNTVVSAGTVNNFGPGPFDFNFVSRLDGDSTRSLMRADLSDANVTLVALSGAGQDVVGAAATKTTPPVEVFNAGGLAFRVSPTGNVLISDPNYVVTTLQALPSGLLLVKQGNVTVVDAQRDTTLRVVSRPEDTLLSVAIQPNSVSAIYTTVAGEVVTTWYVRGPHDASPTTYAALASVQPPTVVTNGTAFNATGSVPGHLIIQGGGIVVFPGGAPLSVAGTAVLAGTLQLSNVCTSGTVAVLNATWVVGQFDQVQLTGCTGCSGGSATQSVSPASSSLSVTVSITCAGGGGGGSGGLSTGAIVGIAVGCVVGACLLVGGIALAVRHQRNVHTRAALRALKANHMSNDVEL